MGSQSTKQDDLEAEYHSPLQSRSLAEAWAESASKKSGRRSAQSQYVQPRMQIKRDLEEAKRVAMMFEHLEHIDDDLSWGGLQAAASAAVQPSRILKTLVILSPFLLSAMTPRQLKVGELPRSSMYELTRTLLTHACAASLSYLVLGFAFQVVTMALLRISRLCRWRNAEKIIYLNGILFQEERAGVSVFCAWAVNFSWWSPLQDTRVLLARPCACILLLLFCNALKKILEFSFLRSKLALNFETDVLVNAFERAALERVADFACLPDAAPELLQFLQQSSVLPILQDPHAFEKLTAEHLRKAYSQGRQRSHKNYSGQLTIRPIGRGLELFRALQGNSTTMFFMKVDGKFREVEAAAQLAFAKIMGSAEGEDEVMRSMSLPSPSEHGDGPDSNGQDETEEKFEETGTLDFMDIAKIMPQDEATRTWEMLTARCGSREVTVEDFVWAVKGAFERFHMIAATVKDLSAIWLVFSNVVSAVHFLLSLAIVLGFFFPSQVLRTVCLSMSTVALGLSFIFGNLLKEIFESLVLLLVIHPYDVGDRILLGDGSNIYTVQKINILTTEARDLANHCVYLKNSKLFHEDILNLGRSLNAVVEINVVFQSSEVSTEVISRINAFVENYISNEKEAWVPSYLRSFCALSGGRATCDLSGGTAHCIRLMHRQPWQSIPEIRRDTSRVMYSLLGQLKKWGLDFRMTPQPVHLETRSFEAHEEEIAELRRGRSQSFMRQESGVVPIPSSSLAHWQRGHSARGG